MNAERKEEARRLALNADILDELRKIIPGLPKHIVTLDLRLRAYNELPVVEVSYYPEIPPPAGEKLELIDRTFKLEAA